MQVAGAQFVFSDKFLFWHKLAENIELWLYLSTFILHRLFFLNIYLQEPSRTLPQWRLPLCFVGVSRVWASSLSMFKPKPFFLIFLESLQQVDQIAKYCTYSVPFFEAVALPAGLQPVASHENLAVELGSCSVTLQGDGISGRWTCYSCCILGEAVKLKTAIGFEWRSSITTYFESVA